MVTCADGAEDFYTAENNEARYESAKEAITLDKKLINSWVGHPSFQIIDNASGKGFQSKIDRCVETVYKMIGLPTSATYHKKFLLVMLPKLYDVMTPKNIKKEVFTVEETYLHKTSEKDQIEDFITKVGKNDSFVYTHEVRLYKNGQRVVKKRQVSAREYIEAMDQKKKNSKDIRKFRQCFIYEQNYF